jgi:hypothetical protein
MMVMGAPMMRVWLVCVNTLITPIYVMMVSTVMVQTAVVVGAVLFTRETPVREGRSVIILVRRLHKPVTLPQALPVPMRGMSVLMMNVTGRGAVSIPITLIPVMTG